VGLLAGEGGVMEELPLMKPAYGAPCNQCGFCCREEICSIGQQMYPNAAAPCPALKWHDGRYWCGLVEMMKGDRLYHGALTMMLGIGLGCDAEDDA
jgi:hypothetical protein